MRPELSTEGFFFFSSVQYRVGFGVENHVGVIGKGDWWILKEKEMLLLLWESIS